MSIQDKIAALPSKQWQPIGRIKAERDLALEALRGLALACEDEGVRGFGFSLTDARAVLAALTAGDSE